MAVLDKPIFKKEKTLEKKPQKPFATSGGSGLGKVKLASWAIVALKNTNLTKGPAPVDEAP